MTDLVDALFDEVRDALDRVPAANLPVERGARDAAVNALFPSVGAKAETAIVELLNRIQSEFLPALEASGSSLLGDWRSRRKRLAEDIVAAVQTEANFDNRKFYEVLLKKLESLLAVTRILQAPTVATPLPSPPTPPNPPSFM